MKSLFHHLSTCASFTAKLDNCTSKLAHLEFTFSRLSIVACAVVMFVRDGRPRRVVQCRSHPGFPLCKHNYWVASLKNSFNIETGISSIPDIKLIRTDTTLDLSQKAEKGMLLPAHKTNLRPFVRRMKINSSYGLRNERHTFAEKKKN